MTKKIYCAARLVISSGIPNMRRHFIVATATVVISLNCVGQAQVSQRGPRGILKKMLARYERIWSYQDFGKLRIVGNDPTMLVSRHSSTAKPVVAEGQTLVSSRTYFARPRMFRFEWQSSSISRSSVIWFDGKGAYSWTTNETLEKDRFIVEKKADFDFLIENALGPSRGMVFTVPSLLMTNMAPYTFAHLVRDLEDLTILKDEVVDLEECHVIKGKVSTTPWVLWVGKKSLLLRKARSLGSLRGFHERLESGSETLILEELHTDIKINKKIAPRVFKYRPELRPGDIDATP